MNVVKANGVHLHYAVDGPADAPAIVFSNSLGTDFRMWDALIAYLGDRFRAVRYDKRGHGLSEATAPPYTIDDHIADLAGLLDHLGLDRFILCGLSVGGLIAQGFAARQPKRLRALILSDTAAKIGSDEMWNTRIATIEQGGIEVLADPIMERWLSAGFRAGRPGETLVWRNMLVRTAVDGYIGTCAAIRDADFSETTRRIRMPVLGIVGSEDGATPPDLVRGTIETIEGARFTVIDGVGHLPSIERPDIMGDLIAGFLKENGLV